MTKEEFQALKAALLEIAQDQTEPAKIRLEAAEAVRSLTKEYREQNWLI